MNWIILTLFSFLMFAISSTIDGVSIKKYIGNSKIYLFYGTLMQGLIGMFVFFFVDVNLNQGIFFLVVAFSTGLFYVYGLLPYMNALKFEEVSRIAPLFQLGPLFVLVLSILFLDINLNGTQYLGFSLLVAGSILISVKRINGLIKISKGFWYMMLTNLLLAGFFIGTDYLFKNYNFWDTFFFIQLGIFISSLTLIFFKEYGIDGIKKFGKISPVGKTLVVSAAIISFAGIGLRNFAIDLKSAALVTSLEGFQVLFVFLITIGMSLKFPQILGEEIDRETLLMKTISIVSLMVGIYFISI